MLGWPFSPLLGLSLKGWLTFSQPHEEGPCVQRMIWLGILPPNNAHHQTTTSTKHKKP